MWASFCDEITINTPEDETTLKEENEKLKEIIQQLQRDVQKVVKRSTELQQQRDELAEMLKEITLLNYCQCETDENKCIYCRAEQLLQEIKEEK